MRLASAADVPALAAIYVDCARALGPQVYTAEQVAAWASFGVDSPAFRQYILGASTWLSVDPVSGAPLGFCGVDAAGEVHSLYVRPDVTRQGRGTALLAQAMGDARARGVSRFGAWATPFSRPLFERAGLVLVRTVNASYQGVMFERYRVEGG